MSGNRSHAVMAQRAEAPDAVDLNVAAELADAVREFRATLPDWWFTCGHCKLSGHATVGPDRDGCDKDLLLIKQFDQGFDIDIEGGTPGKALRQATALAVEARRVWRS